jgi:hypothetical protein
MRMMMRVEEIFCSRCKEKGGKCWQTTPGYEMGMGIIII